MRLKDDIGYEVDVSRHVVPALVKVLRKHGLNEDATKLDDSVEKYGARTVTLTIGAWSLELIDDVLPLLEFEKKALWFLRGLRKMRLRPTTARIYKLELLPQAMYNYLAEEVIDGWIYRQLGEGPSVAYVVRYIVFHPKDEYHHRPAYVSMELKTNKAEFTGEESTREDDGELTISETWGYDDLASGKTAAGCLLKSGLLKETPELKAQYLAELELFRKYHTRHGNQFYCTGTALDVGEKGDWRWSNYDKRYPLPHPTRMVNEEEILHRKVTLECSNFNWTQYIKKGSKAFGTVPVHPFMLFFDLSRHTHCWVHILNVKPYKYDPTLKDKLVLPPLHRDLIDTLTEDMDVFVEDIVEGKSGGTAILCYGEPGLGKTLTSEVYAEVVKRPLYRVHAGQLGTDVETVERELEKILRRSERWGAVLLLDEADVYIRRRGNDLQHNAVIATFLRTLEYFHGLLFLTTNRIGDVDDAIASRMVATFKYETPDSESAALIWTILSKQFGIVLSEKSIGLLVKEYPTASGRDIKQLLKLTMKYCKKKEKKMNLEAFRVCAMFRGIV
jgi:hypothetical protein